jgi:tetraacyldisaccharide 4'-kinase
VLARLFNRIWYRRNHPLSLLLAPLGWLFRLVVWFRRKAYRARLLPSKRFDLPVIVIGNITVGGTGKTPLTVWLAQSLLDAGFQPAIVSHGFGGKANDWPQQVRADSDPVVVGDESVLLARRTGCAVAAGRDRVAVVDALLAHVECDVILCDDGLQHLRLQRDIEIAVVDGVRRHGNGRCLPAGPLREPVSRLRHVDLIVANEGASRGEFEIKLKPNCLTSVALPREQHGLENLRGTRVHAVCGIGNPGRFFAMLERQGAVVIAHEFPDHHQFVAADVCFDDELPVLMTEKDAIKCERFANDLHWYIAMDVEPHHLIFERILSLLKKVDHGPKTT